MRGSPCPRDRPCERPAAALRPGGDPTVTGVPSHPSRRPHGAPKLHNPCPDRPRDTPGLAQYRCRMQGATKPHIRPSRRLARILAANPRAAIYGTIVASAVIATTAGGHQSAERILEATLATLVVFWLAHVYADFLGHGLRHARSNLRLLASIMVQELSMLVAPALFHLVPAAWCIGGAGGGPRGRPGALERRRPAGRLGHRRGTPTRTRVAGGTAHRAGQRRLRRSDRPA